MDEHDKERIKTNLTRLIANVGDFDALINAAIQNELFPPLISESFRITSKTETERKTEFFLASLKRGPAAFGLLVGALATSGNYDAASVLGNVDIPDSRLISQPHSFAETTPPQDRIEVINVKPAKRLYNGITDAKEIYKMTSSPRGYALLVVNKYCAGYNVRLGADEDFRLMSELLTQLGYEIISYRDQSESELKTIVTTFTMMEKLKNADSCIVAISSHGEEDVIACSDGRPVSIKYITSRFNNLQCPNLKGKPKMFFIQACRGSSFDNGVPVFDYADSKSKDPTPVAESYLPTTTDTMIFYATQPGYVAYLNQNSGSWFFSTIVKVMMEYAHNEDLQSLLTKVTRHLNRLKSYPDSEKQATQKIEDGWERKLFFNPGL